MSSTTGGGGGIRRYSEKEGYGYITPDDGGREIYFEVTALGDAGKVSEGQRVVYKARLTTKGLVAYEVTIVSDRA